MMQVDYSECTSKRLGNGRCPEGQPYVDTRRRAVRLQGKDGRGPHCVPNIRDQYVHNTGRLSGENSRSRNLSIP